MNNSLDFKVLHSNFPVSSNGMLWGLKNHYTANVLLVDSTDCVSVTNPTVVQTYFPLILTANLTMKNTVKGTYFYCCMKELIMQIS